MSKITDAERVGQELLDAINQTLMDMPIQLDSRLEPDEALILMVLANSHETCTVEGFPVSHLHAALNALLYVMADFPGGSVMYGSMAFAAHGITTLLDDLAPGAGNAYVKMGEYYRRANEEGE